ncbi:interferon-inducible GTPase 5-like [Pristis pectinata]|uniref:interferon-inducible GTPase 5-like n=1 Tax=Pristis pectinata TaxID=685728 RepID=UPI00223CF5B2|nr:interferon-inducible GTPase 5-like [Pristis pectinata]
MGGANSRETMNPPSNSTFFNPQELKDLSSAYGSGGLEALASLIQDKVNHLNSTKLHIAVTGESGAGKSSFINAMRGLRGCDEGAAKIGNTETTMEPTQYKHPSFPEVSFWDLPGVGTVNFPAKEYPTKMKFEQYDFFIVISRNRFTEIDANLVKEVKKLGKMFYFVRTQIDNDIRSYLFEAVNADREAELAKIRNYCIRSLEKTGIAEPTVFLISSIEINEFDFAELQKTIANNLDDIKKDVFLKSLPSTTLNIVKEKEVQLKKRIWMLATIAGTLGAVPVPGVAIACDIGLLITAIIDFRKYLGLDDASIQRLANATGKPVEVLTAEVKTPLVGEINKDLVKRMLLGGTAVGIAGVETAFKFIPVIGSIFGAGTSFGMTYSLLNNALDQLVQNTQEVVKAAFDNA